MLHESVGLADEQPAKRRWFHDDFFDLFVWQTAGGELVRFQLCYGIHSSERALVWHHQGGFFHDGVEGDTSTHPSPIASSGGAALPKTIARRPRGLQEFAPER